MVDKVTSTLRALVSQPGVSSKRAVRLSPYRLLRPNIMARRNKANMDLVEVLSDLVAFPTITGNTADIATALEYCAAHLRSSGMYVDILELSEGYPALWATSKPNNKRPKVLLAGHIDVVADVPEHFALTRDADKLCGRGTLDMKFAIASYLKIAEELKQDISEYDFGIMLTADEEQGGQNGVAKFVDQGYLPDVCVIPDGGDHWQIQLYSKGFYYLRVSSSGKSAHGSRPWLGENAILRLLDIVQQIQSLFSNMDEQSNTINIGKIRGGDAVNQVPRHASVDIDIRATTEAERKEILKEIKTVCRSHAAELEVILDGAVGSFSLDNSYIARYASLIREIAGVTVEGSHTLGSNDARFFSPLGIPCISIYPPGGGHHSHNEWISETSFRQFHEITKRYIQEIAKS